MTEIAAMLGDTVAIIEKHYADLASKQMEERLSKIPVRPCGCCDGSDTDSVLNVYERPEIAPCGFCVQIRAELRMRSTRPLTVRVY